MPRGQGDGGSLTAPVGGILITVSNDTYRLVVQDPATSEVLWDDSREAGWTKSGAILDLVKDLHKAIRREIQARQGIERQ